MKITRLKKILLATILSFSFNGHALEMSAKNLKILSTLSSDNLYNSLFLIDYKISAIDRRDEATEGVLPVKYDEKSLGLLQQTYADAQDSRKLYGSALNSFSNELPESIQTSCRKIYNFKKSIPELLKVSFANVISYKKNPDKHKVLGAQEWTRLSLLKNYYINSLGSYDSGEVYSELVGVGARCLNDQKLYGDLVENDTKMLGNINNILNQIVGQPGLKLENHYSTILSEKMVENASFSHQAKDFAISMGIEAAIYFSGYGLLKYGVKAITWAPKVYKYAYPAISGAIMGMKAANPEVIVVLDPSKATSNNLALFQKRLKAFGDSEDNLYAQMLYAIEMEQVLFQVRLDFAKEAMSLCNGKCSTEQAVQVKEKLKRNINEIVHVLKTRNINFQSEI